jgi:hypothetical protein
MVNIMNEGLGEGARDHGLFRLSLYLRDKGLPTWATEDVVRGVNERSSPPMDEQALYEKIASAYTNEYSIFPCNEPALDAYCSSACKYWPRKLEDRWTRYGKPPEEAVGRICR